MPIHLHRADEYAIMVLLGIVTEDQLIDAFENMKHEFNDDTLQYLVMEITEMIYQPEVMFAEAVQLSRRELIEHPNLLGVVYILASNHPMRETFSAVYKSHGLGKKLFFAINLNEARELFNQ